jgi:CubicO group peptidase (beta-lactamase class C family)
MDLIENRKRAHNREQFSHTTLFIQQEGGFCEMKSTRLLSDKLMTFVMSVMIIAFLMCGLSTQSICYASKPTKTSIGKTAPPLPYAKPQDVGMSSERLKKVSAYFQKEFAEGRLPGGVIAVARKGKLVLYESFGVQNPSTKVPMKNDAIFRVYSMSKPFVSVAAMQLVEDGVIQLPDPISKYLPEFAKMQVSVPKKDADGKTTYEIVPAERPITVQDLLRHTSGLAYGEITQNVPVKQGYAKAGVYKPGVIDYDSRDMTPAQQVSDVAKAPLAYQPGTRWEYSLSADILGRVTEAASGKTLGEYLSEKVFKPLKMADSGFYVPRDKMHRVAEAFETDPFTKQKFPLLDVSTPPKNDSGGAGAVSTTADYLRFSQMLLNGGSLGDAQVLSPTTIRLMASDHLGDRNPLGPGGLLIGTPEGYTFGLGFLVRQHSGMAGVHGSVGEFMWAGYGGTFFWVEPKEQVAVVFMSQAPGPSRGYYRKTMKNLVSQAIIK